MSGPTSENRTGPYASTRDELLHIMAAFGWANESSGDQNSPSGWFARMSNAREDLVDLVQAFGEEMMTLGVDPRTTIGHFLLTKTADAPPGVEDYPSELLVQLAYHGLEQVYQEWRDES